MNAMPVSTASDVTALVGVEAVLDVLRRHVVALCAESPQLPTRVRVAAGDVAVEVDWAEAGRPLDEVEVIEPPGDTGVHYVCSGTVGVFYRAQEPGAKPFAGTGETVTAGQQVAIVEAMKLMIPVETEMAGTVVEILVDDGAPVEYGQRLMAIAP